MADDRDPFFGRGQRSATGNEIGLFYSRGRSLSGHHGRRAHPGSVAGRRRSLSHARAQSARSSSAVKSLAPPDRRAFFTFGSKERRA